MTPKKLVLRQCDLGVLDGMPARGAAGEDPRGRRPWGRRPRVVANAAADRGFSRLYRVFRG